MLAQIALSTGGWRSGEVCRFALSTRGALRWGLPVCSKHGGRHGLFFRVALNTGGGAQDTLQGCFVYGGAPKRFFPGPPKHRGQPWRLPSLHPVAGGARGRIPFWSLRWVDRNIDMCTSICG